MKANLITIGDEILIGQVVNTNVAYISKKLSNIGVEITKHLVVGDDKSEITGAIDLLLPISDVLIITGGLGPTHDDITKAVISEYFGSKLVLNQDLLDKIYASLKARGVQQISEKNKVMALVPDKCELLANNAGQAPGMLFRKDSKLIISMPGVPQEMKYITDNSVIQIVEEKLRNESSEFVYHHTLLTTGIGESILSDLIQNAVDSLASSTLAFLPSYSGVRLRISSFGSSLELAKKENERIEKMIRENAEQYIYGTGETNLSETLGKILLCKNMTISVAESCTAGLLGGALTDMPGSSAYFKGGEIVYSNEMKTELLGIPTHYFERFGAVSKETALLLAENVKAKFETDLGVSITGIAGPDGGSDEKPVGTVWIGVAYKGETIATKFNFNSTRATNRERAVNSALGMVYNIVKDIEK